MSSPEPLKEQVKAALRYIPTNDEYRHANQKAAFWIPMVIGANFALIESVEAIQKAEGYFKVGLIVFSTMVITIAIAGAASYFAGKWSKK